MEMGKLIINVDILFLNDTCMTMILLWATARFANLRVRWGRLVIGGMLGAAYTVILVLPVFHGLPVGLYVLLHLVLNVTAAVGMIRIAFHRLPRRKFFKTLGYLYLITFLAGGSALSIYFLTGTNPAQWIQDWVRLSDARTWLYLAAVSAALAVGRYGWNLVRERLYKEEYHFQCTIWLEDRCTAVRGLLDTGNLLKDPLSNMPVVIVETSVVLGLCPAEVQVILTDPALDVIDKADALLRTSWFQRFRIIPYSSLGKEGGLLIGLKPDRVEMLGKEVRVTKQVILGLHQGQLNLEGDYQALLHPELLEAM